MSVGNQAKNYSFLHPWFLLKSLCLRSNIKHSTQCFINRWNTSKFVKNTPLRVVFSTLFSVFHQQIKHYVSCLIYYFMSCCSQALQQWCGGTKPPIPTIHVIFFCSKSGRLTQNQEKHSTVDENIRGRPKEKKSATLKLQSQLMGNTCTVYTDGLMTSDLTPLVSRRVIGCEGSEGKGFHLFKTGSQNTIKTNLV